MESTQLSFHPVCLEDKLLMDNRATICGGQNCDINFMNIYGYQFRYHTEVTLWRNHLVFRFIADGHVAYMALIDADDAPSLINLLIDESERNNHPFLLMGVCENMLPVIESAKPDYFSFTYSRDYCDYIYRREALATLAGKKLQSRRNFANRFRRLYPDYAYAPLTENDFRECLSLDKSWLQHKEGEEEDGNTERTYIKRVFNAWQQLGGRGATIRVNGQLVAFTFGAPISNHIFDVCIEKADPLYEGAYAIINQEFASHLPEQFELINSEEDLGIEGLRKVKMAYHPEIVLKKYAVIAKHHFKDGRIK